jgi:hypothetical protein
VDGARRISTAPGSRASYPRLARVRQSSHVVPVDRQSQRRTGQTPAKPAPFWPSGGTQSSAATPGAAVPLPVRGATARPKRSAPAVLTLQLRVSL